MKKRMKAGMLVTAIAMIVIGIIGFERTFVVYGRIEGWMFAVYAIASAIFIGLGIGTAIQAKRLDKVFVAPKPPKPKTGTEKAKGKPKEFVYIPNYAQKTWSWGTNPKKDLDFDDIRNVWDEIDKTEFLKQFTNSNVIITPTGKLYKREGDIHGSNGAGSDEGSRTDD